MSLFSKSGGSVYFLKKLRLVQCQINVICLGEIMNTKKNNLDYLFTIAFFVLITGTAFVEFLPRNEILNIIYIYFSWKIIHNILEKRQLTFSKLSIFIVIFCLVSSIWSLNSISTIKESIKLFIITMIAVYLTNKYNIKVLFRLIFISGFIITISSFMVILILPERGIDQISHIGAWMGVFNHKNSLGNSIAFYFLISMFLLSFTKKKISRLIILGVCVLQLILIFYSQSTTSLVLVIIEISLFVVFLIYRFIKNRYLKAIYSVNIFGLTIIGALIIIINLVSILNLFGKDLTLTGRNVIYRAAIDLISERWLLGYGYRALIDSDNLYYELFLSKIGFTVGSLHNGFLEATANIGVFGIVFIIIALFNYFYKALKVPKREILNFYPLVFFVYLIVLNFTESAFIGSANSLIWVFFVLTQVYLAKLQTKQL